MFRSAVAASMAGALAFTLQGCGGGSGGGSSKPEFTMDCGGECSVTYSCSGGKASAGCAFGTWLSSEEPTEGQTCDSYVKSMKSHYEDADAKKDVCDKITVPPPPTEWVLDCGDSCSVTFYCGSDLVGRAKVSPGCRLPFAVPFTPEKKENKGSCESYPVLQKRSYKVNGSELKIKHCDRLMGRTPLVASEVASAIDDSDAARGRSHISDGSTLRSASASSSMLEKVLYMALGGAVAVAVLLLVRAVYAGLHNPRQARDAKAVDPIELVQVQHPSSATASVP